MRQTFSCLSKLGGTTNLIQFLFGHVKKVFLRVWWIYVNLTSAGMAWIKWRFQKFGLNKMALNSHENMLIIYDIGTKHGIFLSLSRPLTKQKTIHTWNLVHTRPRPNLKHFFLFSKKWITAVRWFFCRPPWLPCIYLTFIFVHSLQQMELHNSKFPEDEIF